MGMTDGRRLRQFVENQNRSVKSIYTALGLSKQGWYNYYETDRMEQHTKDRIEEYFGTAIFGETVNIDPVQKDAPVSDFKANTGASVSDASIRGLIRTNEKLAAAALGDVENRKLLIRQNEELLSMVKQSGNDQSESLEVFGATLATLREFVLELCMKSKTYRSREEARAAFRIRLGELLTNKKGVDIRSDLSK